MESGRNSNLATPLAINKLDSAIYDLGTCIMHTKYFQDSGLAWPNKRRKVHVLPSAVRAPTAPSVDDDNGSDASSSDSDDDETKMLVAMGLPSNFSGSRAHRLSTHPAWLNDRAQQPEPEPESQPEPNPPQWQQAIDPNTGYYYYYCEALQQTQWEPPAEGFRPASVDDQGEAASLGSQHKQELDEAAEPASPLPATPEHQQQRQNQNYQPRSPYQLAVESYMQHHGWFDHQREGGGAGPSPEADVCVQGEWVEDMEGPIVVKRPEIKPRMETTGLMPGIPTPCGMHLRFDDSAEEEEMEVGVGVGVGLDDLTSDMELLAVQKEEEKDSVVVKKKKQKKKKARVRRDDSRPVDLPTHLAKYWMQRYSLFSRYDDGIAMDDEAWFSVTPEIIAWHQAKRIATILGEGCIAVDAFGGVGGNAIQLALTCSSVIGVEIDAHRAQLLVHNAEVYGVAPKVDCIQGDFLQLASTIKADVAFFSPPWGGPEYCNASEYDPTFMSDQGFNLAHLLDLAFNEMGCRGAVAWLPRNTSLQKLASCLPKGHIYCEVERAILNDTFKGITVYYWAKGFRKPQKAAPAGAAATAWWLKG